MASESIQNQLARLRASVAGLEAQRDWLDEGILQPALESLNEKIAALEAQLGLSSQAPAYPEGRRFEERPVEGRPVEERYVEGRRVDERPVEERYVEGRRVERRNIVTVLFTDIVGSTAIASGMDPEDWHNVLQDVLRMVGDLIEKHSGSVVQYLGDGLLALFGAEQMSEQDAENAVRAGLALQSTLAEREEPALQMRVGIHTGLVLLGKVGADVHRAYTATGDTMNLASRLQAVAPPGGVLISHETYRQVRGLFEINKQQLITVKGKPEPVQTYLVTAIRPRPFLVGSRGVSGFKAPTVGRVSEWAQLKSELELAHISTGRRWTQLIGPPGIGKSRLLAEVVASLDERPGEFHILRARASQGDEHQAYALVRRLWFDRFQIAEDISLEEAETRWMEQFTALCGSDCEESAQVLGILTGLPFHASPYINILQEDPVKFKDRAVLVSSQLIASLRAEKAVIILFEDLQWADASSWDYLVRVLLSPEPAPHGLLVLGTARPEWDPPAVLLSHTGYHSLPLAPLSEEASLELAHALLTKVEEVPGEIYPLVASRCEGLPYYLEEIINWFIDSDIIDQQAGTARFIADRFATLPLPTSLQHLLFTRLDALSESERLTLQCGSIFGRVFWKGGLEALGALDCRSDLEHLQQSGLLDRQVESILEGEDEWTFQHALFQEVTYESILKRQRRRMHRSAGAWLEMKLRKIDRLEEFSGRLGEHAERAGEPEVAADWFLIAGQSATQRGALLEARRFLDRAFELTPPGDRDRRWQVLLDRDNVFRLLGDTQARQAADNALVAMAQEAGNNRWLAEAYYRKGYYVGVTGNIQSELEAYNLALEAARLAGDRKWEGLVLPLKVICLTRLGQMEMAATTAQEALSLAQELGNETILARALTNVVVYHIESGNLAHAARLLAQQVEVNQRLGDRQGQMMGLLNLGYNFLLLGQFVKGRSVLESARDLSNAIGDRRAHAYANLNLAMSYYRTGDLFIARRTLEETTQELVQLKDVFGRATAETYLGLVLEKAGETVAARQSFESAMDRLSQTGATGFEMDARAGIARCCLALNDLKPAESEIEMVWKFLKQNKGQGLEFPALAYLTCARLFAALGYQVESEDAARQGCHEVLARSERIEDADWKKSFLENVPEHGALIDRNLSGGKNETRPEFHL